MIEVYGGRKGRYWVKVDDIIVFESESGSEALQWAIDYASGQTIYPSVIPPIELKTGIMLDSSIRGYKRKKKLT